MYKQWTMQIDQVHLKVLYSAGFVFSWQALIHDNLRNPDTLYIDYWGWCGEGRGKEHKLSISTNRITFIERFLGWKPEPIFINSIRWSMLLFYYWNETKDGVIKSYIAFEFFSTLIYFLKNKICTSIRIDLVSPTADLYDFNFPTNLPSNVGICSEHH